ncbi:thiaminase/4-amino-5-aminomethyl-2-methylpyrimidine deaminase [Klenkia soli]|uniref:Thiaminase/4-amino-5-aminomethyl-2-methylpyrimidine deaminase n=1 Tax=Klenkia soli TaxID=1052260 RepID=A0A1H0RFT0_9ACTN|nr:TenA family protein [Klenkia soli]SDP28423.1 thiaminase/4-amino-5-aminomethyl-2-methylpyrimidine deaminase [Klenkia soli]
MSFTDDAWARTAALRDEIDALPFLAELADGSLAAPAFRFYLEQDALYLAGYAKALALLAARAPDPQAAAFWAGSAQTAAVVETQLHGDLLGLLGGGPRATEHSPTCLAYVSYLVATAATEPYPVGCAAVLPCFWVYAHTGARLAATARGTEGHPYLRWVATYDDPAFQESTRRARELTDAAATPELAGPMHRAFALATAYERDFWASVPRQSGGSAGESAGSSPA